MILAVGIIRQAVSLKRRAEPDTEGYQSNVTPPSRATAAPVTLTTAVSLVPVYRSFQILATVGGQLDLGVTRGGIEIEPPPLAATPDVNLTPSRFYKRSIVSLAATGRAIWKKHRFADGTVASYEVLNPLAVHRIYDANGRPVYRHVAHRNGRTYVEDLKPSDVRHLKLLEVPGFDDGVGPIQAGRISLAGARDLRDYASNWFTDSGVPNGVLSTDTQINKEVADATRDRFKESVAGHDLAVVGYGFKYSPIMLKPEDAQWLEAQQFTVTEVARLFGIPASYLLAEVNGSSMTYSNLEQVDTQFLKTTLMGYLTEIEEAVTADLPRGQRAKFKTAGLLRSDNKTRAEVDAIYIDKGVYDARYVAARDGIPAAPQPTKEINV